MHNIFRFIIGLVLTFFIIVILSAVLLALVPVFLGVALTIGLLAIIGSVLYAIILFFAFVWYFSRNKVKIKKTKKSFKFSIKQGKEI